MTKKLLFAAAVLSLLLSFCTAFADQSGSKCWCNIDESGCWITGESGGKSYIMFWSEDARLAIMGSGSTPYKYVVARPGFSATFPLECSVDSIPGNSSPEPPEDPCQQEYAQCMTVCAASDCLPEANCYGCEADCKAAMDSCKAGTAAGKPAE